LILVYIIFFHSAVNTCLDVFGQVLIRITNFTTISPCFVLTYTPTLTNFTSIFPGRMFAWYIFSLWHYNLLCTNLFGNTNGYKFFNIEFRVTNGIGPWIDIHSMVIPKTGNQFARNS
jgi:hypothetical protein